MSAGNVVMYWPSLFCAASFMAWAHVHTDEIPVVFGFLLILGTIMGALFSGRFIWSWLALGAPVPLMETLHHFALVRAPYDASSLATIAVIAPISLLPPLAGVAFGTWVRHLVRGSRTASPERR